MIMAYFRMFHAEHGVFWIHRYQMLMKEFFKIVKELYPI